jgi:hypothetical protein
MKMVKGVPPRQYFFSLKKIGRLIKRSLRLSTGLKSTEKNVEKAKTYEGKFKAMFTKKTILFGIRNPLDLVPQPGNLLNTWDEDKEFARQFLNGVNPVMIQVVKDVDTQLTSEIVQFFATDHTIDLYAKEKKRTKKEKKSSIYWIRLGMCIDERMINHSPLAFSPRKKLSIDLHALADDKRLFFATYEDLMDLKKDPVS